MPSQADEIKLMAMLGRRDLLFLMRNILGYDWVNEREHRELCDFLMCGVGESKNGVIGSGAMAITIKTREYKNFKRSKYSVVAARGTLKSTICSQGYPLWRMVRGEVDLRVLLDAETRDHAKARLDGIKTKLDASVFFKKCYGVWNGKTSGYKWNEEEATIAVRATTSVREASYETAGIDVVKNSRHYDMIIPDDCHSDKNSANNSQIDSVKKHYRVLQPMLDKAGEFIIVCTWWDDKDANRWFSEMMGSNVSLFQRSCWLDKAKTRPRYPERLPVKELEMQRKILGAYLFSCQFLLDPVSSEDAMFRQEDIQIVPAREIPKNLRRYVLCDPAGDPTAASEEKRDSDNWALGCLAVSPAGNIYLLDLAWDKFTPTEGIEEILKMILKWNPHVTGIEKTGLGNTGFFVKENLRQMGRFAIVEDLNPAGRSKTKRVSGLDPIVRTRRFYISSDCPHQEEIMDEFIRFTRHGSKAKHDDIPDMCAYVMDMIEKYGMAIGDSEENNQLSQEEKMMYLNPGSRKYWDAYNKKNKEKSEESWISDFVS